MSKKFNEEEKKQYIDNFKKSGLSINKYAKENGIPRASLYRWIKEEAEFGFSEIKTIQKNEDKLKSTKKKALFENEMVRIELKEGFNKDFVLKIVEVMTNA